MKTRNRKFQALVSPVSPDPGRLGTGTSDRAVFELPPGRMLRMVVRAEHHRTHATGFFDALVSNDGEHRAMLGSDHAIVTIMLAGEQPDEYLGVGDPVLLWQGHDVAAGMITRRLFT